MKVAVLDRSGVLGLVRLVDAPPWMLFVGAVGWLISIPTGRSLADGLVPQVVGGPSSSSTSDDQRPHCSGVSVSQLEELYIHALSPPEGRPFGNQDGIFWGRTPEYRAAFGLFGRLEI
jgi:hypothetical protein